MEIGDFPRPNVGFCMLKCLANFDLQKCYPDVLRVMSVDAFLLIAFAQFRICNKIPIYCDFQHNMLRLFSDNKAVSFLLYISSLTVKVLRWCNSWQF